MKLYFAPTSPFARKVRIAIRQLGLDGQVQEIAVDPWTSAELRQVNPLAKVPALQHDDGSVLIESAAICEYMDQEAQALGHNGAPLFPPAGEARWTALRRQAVADGLCTAAARLYADEQRPAGERSPAVMQRQRETIAAALVHLKRDASWLDPKLQDIGAITVACALAYFGFRWPGSTGWRSAHASLAAWFDAVDNLPVMRETGYHLHEAEIHPFRRELRAGY